MVVVSHCLTYIIIVSIYLMGLVRDGLHKWMAMNKISYLIFYTIGDVYLYLLGPRELSVYLQFILIEFTRSP